MPEPVEELTAATEELLLPSIAAAKVLSKSRANVFRTNNRIDNFSC